MQYLHDRSPKQACLELEARTLRFDPVVGQMRLQKGGFGTGENSSIAQSFQSCVGLGAYAAALPSASLSMRQLVFTEQGFMRGCHRWEVRIDALENPSDIETRLVIGVATKSFQMGSCAHTHHGIACFLGHAGEKLKESDIR